MIRNSKTKHERVKRRTYDQPSQPLHSEQDLSEAMDGIMNDRIDYDYYVEEDSDAEFSEAEHSSGDERGFESSMEQLENEVNFARDEKSVNEKEYDAFEMDDQLYLGSNGNQDKDIQHVKEDASSQPQEQNNDDLLYDPNLDDEDERWIEKERQKHRVKKKNSSGEKETNAKANDDEPKPLKSDAILSCPACMTTVCIDCQRHDTYKTQYRAMFVMNCEVIKDELLRYEEKRQKKKKKSQKPGTFLAASENDADKTELYNPVKCMECGTQVAVYDFDEVYHFFNILASQA